MALLLSLVLATSLSSQEKISDPPPAGAPFCYQLPVSPENATYRVTIAATDPHRSADWIFSTFISGANRTVTAENKGKFCEVFDGLDDFGMPIKPGTYGLKGIYMNATVWHMDKKWHSLVAQYEGAIDMFMVPLDQDDKPFVPQGDPVGRSYGVLAASPDLGNTSGRAFILHQYMENGHNGFLWDLTKQNASGYDQLISYGESWGTSSTEEVFVSCHSPLI